MPIVMSVSTGTDWVERREFRKRRDKNLIQSVIQLFSSSFLSFLLHSIHRSSFCCLFFLLILLPTLSFTLFKNSPILRSTYSEGRSRLNRKILLPSFSFHFIPFLLLLLPLILFLEEEILKKFDHPVSRESPSSLLFFPSLSLSFYFPLSLSPSSPSPSFFSHPSLLLSLSNCYQGTISSPKSESDEFSLFFILFNVLFLSSFPLLVSLMISLAFLSFLPQFPLSSHTFSLSSFFWKWIFPHTTIGRAIDAQFLREMLDDRCFRKVVSHNFNPIRKREKKRKVRTFDRRERERKRRGKEREGVLNKSQRVKKTGHRWYSFYWIKTRVIESMLEGKRKRRKGRKRERERRKGRKREGWQQINQSNDPDPKVWRKSQKLLWSRETRFSFCCSCRKHAFIEECVYKVSMCLCVQKTRSRISWPVIVRFFNSLHIWFSRTWYQMK